MSEKTIGPEYLRIGEAARLLGVTQRWIYQRVWSGDLPANKVGGLYFIRREDLEALMGGAAPSAAQSAGSAAALPEQLPLPKCGYCFRLLRDESQIGAICQAEGCDAFICTRCQAEGVQYCARHTPTREQRWQAALARYEKGELPVLLKSADARLRELNYLNRIQERLARVTTLAHPASGEVLHISAWEAARSTGDERAELMSLLGTAVLSEEQTSRLPLNSYLRFALPRAKNQKGAPLEVRIQVLNHTAEMLRDGFDTRPLGDEELQPRLLRLGEEAERAQSILLVLLAANTGWEESARRLVRGGDGQLAFHHRHLMFYLYDMQSGELLYNRMDERLRRYVELFSPRLASEEIEEAAAAVERELLLHESLTLNMAASILPYPTALLRQAFERLAESGAYKLMDVPQLGITLVRK